MYAIDIIYDAMPLAAVLSIDRRAQPTKCFEAMGAFEALGCGNEHHGMGKQFRPPGNLRGSRIE